MNIKPITLLLLVANVGVAFWMLIKFGSMTDTNMLLQNGAMYAPVATWSTFVTANFIHIGLPHLISNMVSLYIFGNIVENFVGWWRYIIIYMVSAIAGTTAVYFFNPNVVTAGASTAIFGLMGAMAVLVVKYGNLMREYSLWLLLVMGYNLYQTFTQPGISIPGHLGGLIAGLLVTTALMWGLKVSYE